MTKSSLSLEDLAFGFLNPVTDPNTGNTASRRRSNPGDWLRSTIQSLYSSHALIGLNTFKGIVVFVGEKQVGLADQKDKLLEIWATRGPGQSVGDLFSSDKTELVPVYKVYIPELECRPVPLSFDDPIILTYYDVYSEVGAGWLGSGGPELGSVVEVRFSNLDTFTGGTIISVGQTVAFEGLSDQGLATEHSGKKSTPASRTGASGGSGVTAGGGGTPTPESPAGLKYTKFRNGSPEWSAIQIHYTVTFNTQDAINVLAGRELSYNYIIGKDGSVTMAVDPSKAVARHAGRGAPDRTRIGISFVNLGYDFRYAGGGWGGRTSPPLSQWIPSGRAKYQGKEQTLYWEPYTPAAIQAGKNLVKRLVSQYPDIKTIFGHEDTSSGKFDPGPAFDSYWPAYEALLPSGRGSTARSNKMRGNTGNA
jgi:N-acetyl-anhydromuramyl-L-alanine amidase AmpD